MSNWAFYNAVRAWVAQHPIPPVKTDDTGDEADPDPPTPAPKR